MARYRAGSRGWTNQQDETGAAPILRRAIGGSIRDRRHQAARSIGLIPTRETHEVVGHRDLLSAGGIEGGNARRGTMRAYVLRRLLALLPTLFFASVIVFVTVRLIPGDVIDLMLSQNDIAANKLSRDQLVAALGLDKPMWEQYGRWISAILFRGDFGQSLWQSTPVSELLAARLPVTFELGLLALIIALIIALPIGVYSAIRQDTAGDYFFRSLSFLMLAVPAFWTGTMVMVLPSIWWGWSPEVKYVPFGANPLQNLKQMLIPAFILGTALSAITMRLTRTQMLEVLRQDYIRTAWAKGLNARTVTMRHALRNALVPVVTLVGLQAPLLIGGAVIVEQIFVIPGMGLLLLDAVNQRDYPVITGVFLIVGVAVMVINLAVDLSYGLLDPRVRYR
jgi:peptide/nickel transport system permease protein